MLTPLSPIILAQILKHFFQLADLFGMLLSQVLLFTGICLKVVEFHRATTMAADQLPIIVP